MSLRVVDLSPRKIRTLGSHSQCEGLHGSRNSKNVGCIGLEICITLEYRWIVLHHSLTELEMLLVTDLSEITLAVVYILLLTGKSLIHSKTEVCEIVTCLSSLHTLVNTDICNRIIDLTRSMTEITVDIERLEALRSRSDLLSCKICHIICTSCLLRTLTEFLDSILRCRNRLREGYLIDAWRYGSLLRTCIIVYIEITVVELDVLNLKRKFLLNIISCNDFASVKVVDADS